MKLLEGDADAARQVIDKLKLAMDGVVGVSLDLAYMRTFLSDDRHYLIAAYADDTPVGFILGYRLHRVDGPRSMMLLYEVGVLEQYRRRGIGRALVDELKRLAEENGCLKMFVATETSNGPAMALYRSAGGVRVASDAAGFEWSW